MAISAHTQSSCKSSLSAVLTKYRHNYIKLLSDINKEGLCIRLSIIALYVMQKKYFPFRRQIIPKHTQRALFITVSRFTTYRISHFKFCYIISKKAFSTTQVCDVSNMYLGQYCLLHLFTTKPSVVYNFPQLGEVSTVCYICSPPNHLLHTTSLS